MRKLKVNYTKDGNRISSITEKNNWIQKSLFNGPVNVLVIGLILFFITLWITNSLNPNPIIEKSCYKEGDQINFILYNPSKAPAEDFSMILYESELGGGKSYVDYELCNVERYEHQLKYTHIHCNYIPPRSYAKIGISFNDKNKTKFHYSSWGKTTPQEDSEKGNYILNCSDD